MHTFLRGLLLSRMVGDIFPPNVLYLTNLNIKNVQLIDIFIIYDVRFICLHNNNLACIMKSILLINDFCFYR